MYKHNKTRGMPKGRNEEAAGFIKESGPVRTTAALYIKERNAEQRREES